jgi:hypothetical protein
MKLFLLLCAAALVAGFGLRTASAQTSPITGQAVSVATPTPGPSGTSSTALNSSLTGGGPANGQGSMGTGVNTATTPVSAVPPTIPGNIIINSNANSIGTGNVAGSVQINNGGPGSVTGAPVNTSSIPTYVTPGSGLGTPASASTTTSNPNPGSVQ